MREFLQLESIQRFVKGVGGAALEYFGKDPAAIIYLRPDGTFYGFGLYHFLKTKLKNITLSTMEDDGAKLEESKVRGRKVLIVDNDIVTGQAFKKSMEALRLKRESLALQDIKYAVFLDRMGLADFKVMGEYAPNAIWKVEQLDGVDHKIISFLALNGRESFVKIAKKLKMSSVAVQKRVSRLMLNRILEIRGALRIDSFYTLSASVLIDANQKAVKVLLEKTKEAQEVYHLAKRSGNYNIEVGILGRSLEEIDAFVEKEIRPVEGIRSLDISIGELPMLPRTFTLRF